MPRKIQRVGGKEAVLAAIAALPERRVSERTDAIKSTVDFLSGAYGAVRLAAKIRRLSPAAYMRRAVLAMVAHDLELPLSDLIERDPRMSRESGFAVEDPQGTKFGQWEIERLVGETNGQ